MTNALRVQRLLKHFGYDKQMIDELVKRLKAAKSRKGADVTEAGDACSDSEDEEMEQNETVMLEKMLRKIYKLKMNHNNAISHDNTSSTSNKARFVW